QERGGADRDHHGSPVRHPARRRRRHRDRVRVAGHRPAGHPVHLQPRLSGGAVRGVRFRRAVHRHQLLRRPRLWPPRSSCPLGLLAGFRSGWTDTVIMTLADAQLAFPFILLAIGIIAVIGPSFPTLIVVVGLSGWVNYARVIRAQVLTLRSREFVDSIRALGG